MRELEPAGQVDAADRRPSTSGVSTWSAPSPCFAAVEDPEHQDGAVIVPVLKSVCATEHLDEEFAYSSRPAMAGPNFGCRRRTSVLSTSSFAMRAEGGKPFVEECCKSIEVGEGVERPLDLYGPGDGRNPDVPQVRSHCTTGSCATREPPAARAISTRATRSLPLELIQDVSPLSAYSSTEGIPLGSPPSYARA